MRLHVERIGPLAALILLGGCLGLGSGGSRPADSQTAARTGPAADYPMVIGEAYAIGDITHTPADKLNYDAVGRASVSGEGAGGVSAAHQTLPLPSYAEVTSLESGRTILVRLERRGPMRNDRLIELSPLAAAQLGAAEAAPVRVRRVNPPEFDRALLRSGQEAPPRMETPKSLLAVLLRKLDGGTGTAPPPKLPPQPAAPPTPAIAARPQAPVAPVAAKPAASAPAAARGEYYVQAAAFSTQARADDAAGAIDGHVVPHRGLWHLRVGPFDSAAQAQGALAKARAAGYSDARIRRAD